MRDNCISNRRTPRGSAWEARVWIKGDCLWTIRAVCSRDNTLHHPPARSRFRRDGRHSARKAQKKTGSTSARESPKAIPSLPRRASPITPPSPVYSLPCFESEPRLPCGKQWERFPPLMTAGKSFRDSEGAANLSLPSLRVQEKSSCTQGGRLRWGFPAAERLSSRPPFPAWGFGGGG